MFDNDAPVYFCGTLGGITYEGPVAILSFWTPVPSQDCMTSQSRVNVRIAMPSLMVGQMAEWLVRAMTPGAEPEKPPQAH